MRLCGQVADESQAFRGWWALHSSVLAAVGCPCQKFVITQFSPEQGVVAEQVIGPDALVEFLFRQLLSRRNLRPENPQTGRLQAGLGGPTGQTLLCIEVTRHTLDFDEIDGFRRRQTGLDSIVGDRLCSKALEIAVADGPREHVQQLEVPGLVINSAELVS